MLIGIVHLRRCRQIGKAVAAVAAAGVLLAWPQAAANGVRQGLAVCGQLLVPSLFPFLMLTGFLVRGGFIASFGRRLEPLMRRLFGLSGAGASAWLLSMIGGYPAGATAVAGLTERGDISKEEGRRLMHVCVNAGPAFILGAVGTGMLGSAQAGLLLLAAHWGAALILLGIERRSAPPSSVPARDTLPLSRAVNDSIHATTEMLLAMCGFVLAASAALTVLDAAVGEPHALWRQILGAAVEVSTGCLEVARTGALAPFLLGAALGFGGLAVHGQIAAVTADDLLGRGFLRARLLHALLGGTLSFILFRLFPPRLQALETAASLSAFHEQNPFLAVTALLAVMMLCVLFLYTLPNKNPRLLR